MPWQCSDAVTMRMLDSLHRHKAILATGRIAMFQATQLDLGTFVV
jgi:hypothetical protein